MDSPKITYKYYSNPAFCAQSEVVYTQQAPCMSPRITISPKSKAPPPGAVRVPPLGAISPRKILSSTELSNHRTRTDISDNPLRLKPESPMQYQPPKLPPKPGPKPAMEINQNRFGSMRVAQKTPVKLQKRCQSMRTSALKNQDLELRQVNNNVVVSSETDSNAEEETEIAVSNMRIVKHRYAEIPDDIEDFSPSKKRIVDNVLDEYNVDAPSENEYKEVPTEIVRSVNGKIHRYAIIPSEEEEDEEEIEEETIVYKEEVISYQRAESPPTFHIRSPGMSRKNLEATQRLHELLSTPKKQIKKVSMGSPLKSCASSPSIRSQMNTPNRMFSPERRNGFPVTPSKRIMTSTPKQSMTPSKSCVNLTSPPLPRRNPMMSSPISPKAQQKLSYESPDRRKEMDYYVKDHERSFDLDRSRDFDRMKMFERKSAPSGKTTAVISPRIAGSGGSSSLASVFSGNNFKATPGCATLAIAAAMLALCGGLGASLSLYIIYTFGRKYYLDFGVISGFTCFILGILGFRSSSYKMLPNRNYVSGYMLLSVFSIFSCAALFVILVKGGVKGPLEDAIGGAVSCLGALCPILALLGACASCCCSRTPPDNRVADV